MNNTETYTFRTCRVKEPDRNGMCTIGIAVPAEYSACRYVFINNIAFKSLSDYHDKPYRRDVQLKNGTIEVLRLDKLRDRFVKDEITVEQLYHMYQTVCTTTKYRRYDTEKVKFSIPEQSIKQVTDYNTGKLLQLYCVYIPVNTSESSDGYFRIMVRAESIIASERKGYKTISLFDQPRTVEYVQNGETVRNTFNSSTIRKKYEECILG